MYRYNVAEAAVSKIKEANVERLEALGVLVEIAQGGFKESPDESSLTTFTDCCNVLNKVDRFYRELYGDIENKLDQVINTNTGLLAATDFINMYKQFHAVIKTPLDRIEGVIMGVANEENVVNFVSAKQQLFKKADELEELAVESPSMTRK